VKYFDAHGHTNVSYCGDPELTLDVYQAALDDPRGLLGRQAITNHGFQAYFPSDIAWSWAFLDDPALFDRYRARGDERLLGVRDAIRALGDDRFLFGVEVELMADGRLTASAAVRDAAEIIVGSLHELPRSYGYEESSTDEEGFRAFIAYTRALAGSGVDVIAHPLRWLGDAIGAAPRELIVEVVRMADEHGCAVELNTSGSQIGQIELIRQAVAEEVPIALGTDAHRPADVGRLGPHLALIREAGFDPQAIAVYRGRPCASRSSTTG
jgi:histidinol phosphatase-like PHP family hydrolase